MNEVICSNNSQNCVCKATAKTRRAIQDGAGHRPEQVEADKRGRQADLALCGRSGYTRQTSDDAGSILAWLGYSKIFVLALSSVRLCKNWRNYACFL